MVGKMLNRFTIGLAIGYVLGAKAGRARYEQIMGWWNRAVGTPAVQRMTEQGRELAGQAAQKAQEVGAKVPGVGALVAGGNGHGADSQEAGSPLDG
jgi:hypothetical protein